MKKTVLTLGIAMLLVLGGATFIGCGNSESSHEEVAETEYYCPMKCEGEKTYTDKDKPCPTCGMDLVEKE